MTASGKAMGLSYELFRKTISETKSFISDWLGYAEKCGISEERAAQIQSGISSAGK